MELPLSLGVSKALISVGGAGGNWEKEGTVRKDVVKKRRKTAVSLNIYILEISYEKSESRIGSERIKTRMTTH